MKDNIITPNITDNSAGEINLIENLVVDKKSLIFKDSVSGDILDKDSIIELIKDSNNDSLPKAIHVEIEATHTGITKNYTEYMPDNMKRSAKTWTSPYNKPVLKAHDQREDALGRVIAYEFKDSVLNPEKKTIQLKLEITEPGSIRRHLDNTALTYSIGAHAKQVFCSICGIDLIADDYCGHWKGRTYNKKTGDDKNAKGVKETCIWQIGDMEYVEVSEVNVPADVWAQKLSVKVKEEDSLKDCVDEPDQSIFDDIDNLSQADSNTSSNEPEDNDGTNLENNEDQTDDNNQVNELKELTDKLETIENEKKDISEKLDVITLEKDELTKEVKDLKEKTEKQNSTNIKLSKLLKKAYTDSIVNAKIRLGDITKEKSLEESEKLLILGAKELVEMFDEYVDKELNIPQSIPQITQADAGALGVYQDNVDSEPKQDKASKNKKKKPRSMKDAINGLLEDN
jgi:hypothetical protein